ncbi:MULTISPECIES: LVIVD repeat-containing protein [unclassified Nonomuraea]|uniref:LVIVD repeat-containing protein n=1 Tax=unclassified Nonomuraea TaxID=2593643 RepID=UPI0035C042CC
MISAKLRGALLCTVLLLASACAAESPATGEQPPATSPQETSAPAGTRAAPPSGDVMMSDNVKQVANMPRTAPFNGEGAFNTDLAFQGDYAYVGNFGGFTIYDISDPTKPELVSQVSCPAQQNDVTIYGDLLVLSIDEPQAGEECDSGEGGREWEGLRIFDVSDKKSPQYVGAVKTECGSHTHTMVPDGDTLYVYVSSPGPEPDSATCPAPHELIQIVEIPTKSPQSAKIVAKPDIFPERQHSELASGCHDITAYPEKKLAAAACFGDGVLLDISDPIRPKVLQQLTDLENFQIWHSATFNNDGTKVVFGDELGGGGQATCDRNTPVTKGANAVYELVDGKLERRGYFKIPREQQPNENCVAHNGSLIPVPGKDIMVQSWYQGGVSIWDFTDSANPKEIGFFERGPQEGAGIAGTWSAYYYNGYIYSSDMTEGLDVLEIDDPLTDPAKQVKMDDFNVQTQKSY